MQHIAWCCALCSLVCCARIPAKQKNGATKSERTKKKYDNIEIHKDPAAETILCLPACSWCEVSGRYIVLYLTRTFLSDEIVAEPLQSQHMRFIRIEKKNLQIVQFGTILCSFRKCEMQEVDEEWKRQKRIRTNTNICLGLFSLTQRRTRAGAHICNHSHSSQSFGDVAELVRRHRCSLAYTRMRFVHGGRAPHRISIQFSYARNPNTLNAVNTALTAHTQGTRHLFACRISTNVLLNLLLLLLLLLFSSCLHRDVCLFSCLFRLLANHGSLRANTQ